MKEINFFLKNVELEKFGKLKRVTIISKEKRSTNQCLAQFESFGSCKDAIRENVRYL